MSVIDCGVSPFASVDLMATSSVSNLTAGSLAKVDLPVDAFYKYSATLPTGLSVDAISVVASTTSGYWVRLAIPSPSAQRQSIWFIDSTGNDTNNGGISAPIKTWSEYRRRTNLSSFVPQTITLNNNISEAITGVINTSSIITITGASVNGSGGTVTSYTAQNTSASAEMATINLGTTGLSVGTRLFVYVGTTSTIRGRFVIVSLVSDSTYNVLALNGSAVTSDNWNIVSYIPVTIALTANPATVGTIRYNNLLLQSNIITTTNDIFTDCKVASTSTNSTGGTFTRCDFYNSQAFANGTWTFNSSSFRQIATTFNGGNVVISGGLQFGGNLTINGSKLQLNQFGSYSSSNPFQLINGAVVTTIGTAHGSNNYGGITVDSNSLLNTKQIHTTFTCFSGEQLSIGQKNAIPALNAGIPTGFPVDCSYVASVFTNFPTTTGSSVAFDLESGGRVIVA